MLDLRRFDRRSEPTKLAQRSRNDLHDTSLCHVPRGECLNGDCVADLTGLVPAHLH